MQLLHLKTIVEYAEPRLGSFANMLYHPIFQLDSHVNFANVGTYMGMPSRQTELIAQQREGKAASGHTRSTKESFSIRTNLCSTKLTQNCEWPTLVTESSFIRSYVFISKANFSELSSEDLLHGEVLDIHIYI